MNIVILRCFYWLPSGLFMWLIFHTFTAPISAPSGMIKIPHLDKLVHFATYGILSVCYFYGICKTAQKFTFNIALIAIVMGAVYGFLIEVCQIYYGRNFEIGDIIANTFGSFLICYMCYSCGNKVAKIKYVFVGDEKMTKK